MRKSVFNIMDFGAVPNVAELQTDKIQAAIDKCFESGGEKLSFPRVCLYAAE